MKHHYENDLKICGDKKLLKEIIDKYFIKVDDNHYKFFYFFDIIWGGIEALRDIYKDGHVEICCDDCEHIYEPVDCYLQIIDFFELHMNFITPHEAAVRVTKVLAITYPELSFELIFNAPMADFHGILRCADGKVDEFQTCNWGIPYHLWRVSYFHDLLTVE